MSQDLNNLFRSNPLAFAQANVLWPGDAEGVGGLEPNKSTGYFKAQPSIATGESLFQLRGEKRIWSCDLTRNGSRVMLMKKPGKVDPPAMAIYYLPWAKDQCLRTVLRKTRDQSLRGTKTAIVQNPANNAANPAQDTNDPDIFFTAGVNGCMVVVEGTREEPIVYHANAISHAGSPMEAAISAKDANMAQSRIDQKVNLMGTRLGAMSTAAPKNPKGVVQTAAARKGTIQSDYMILAAGGELGAGEERQWSSIQSNIARTIGIQRQSNKRVRVQSSLGTVFGHRNNQGKWTFYFQKLVCYEIWQKTGTVFTKWVMQQGNLWYVADCREFWPNGAGHAV
jgi:hypothetical protein